MRIMIIMKAPKSSEAGEMPTEALLAAMGRYNEELVNAGIMVSGEGLHPSARGKRVLLDVGGGREVVDGPFAETKELVAGFWLWKVESLDEAVAWAKRCPNPMPGERASIELRPVFEADDFGPELTPELRAREDRLRVELERQQKG